MRAFVFGVLGITLCLQIVPASAQSLLEAIAGLKFCKTLKDDGQRLKCFDSLSIEPAKSAANAPPTQKTWEIKESRSPLDDSPQLSATLAAQQGDTALLLRCKEHKTEAAFMTGPFTLLGLMDSVKVIVRIGETKPIQTSWSPSTTGHGAFAPSAVQFIRALPDKTKLFIRGIGVNGNTVDGEFETGDVSAVRSKIAEACKWPAEKQTAH